MIARLRRAWRAGLRAYEGAQQTAQHRNRPLYAAQSPDAAVELAGTNLREWARHLDQNFDIAIAVLDELVTHVVGTGVSVEPRPRVAGRVSEPLADEYAEAFHDWSRAPEVTGELPRGEMERLVCRGWLRDGEQFAQHVPATADYPWMPGSVRYLVEIVDPDQVPLSMIGVTVGPNEGQPRPDRWRHGVAHNSWGQPVAYAVLRENPNDATVQNTGTSFSMNAKVVPRENMLHLKFARRWPQTRGVPILHGVIKRLADLKDYEESERIAARVAASMCAFIQRSAEYVPAHGDQQNGGNVEGYRPQEMASGMIFNDLAVGETIGTIDTNRPNTELGNFRAAMVRSVCAGTATRYSAVARDYSGTYSSQRQELVEAAPHYRRLFDLFVARWTRPIYERWLTQALLQGVVTRPAGVEVSELVRAEYSGPGQPWIDPLKETQADILAIQNKLKTREQVLRDRGLDPRAVAEESDMTPDLRVVDDEEDDDETDTAAAIA